jgi:outer membrane protein assembly factor BamB
MTGLLKDTFTEEAEAIGDPNVDLAAIVATGNRRLKRRRLAKVIVAVAASAAVVTGGLTAAQQFGRGEGVRVASGPLAERRPTWADGKQIHYGAEVIRVPAAISSFLQTNEAFVFTTTNGDVYRTDPDGGATRIGRGSKSHRLAADADRSIVGWVDATAKIPQFVLYDLVAGNEVARTATGNRVVTAAAEPPRVSAIDDGVAYFGASDGLRRWDIATGTGELIKPKAAPTFLLAAEAGQLLWEQPIGGDHDLGVGKDPNALDPAHFEGWSGIISPQARYLLTDKADVTRLVEVRTGTTTTITIPGYVLIVASQWKDDRTFFAIGFRTEDSPLDLLTCTIRSADRTSCDVSVTAFAPPLTDKSTVQFPNGIRLNES